MEGTSPSSRLKSIFCPLSSLTLVSADTGLVLCCKNFALWPTCGLDIKIELELRCVLFRNQFSGTTTAFSVKTTSKTTSIGLAACEPVRQFISLPWILIFSSEKNENNDSLRVYITYWCIEYAQLAVVTFPLATVGMDFGVHFPGSLFCPWLFSCFGF